MKLLELFGSIALGLASAPIAGAMIASVDGITVHNTAPTDYVSEIWNRTVQLNTGTGTYLGKSADGKHWVLTAAHVPVGNGTIVTSTGEVIGLSATTEAPVLFYNDDGTQADLKLFSVIAAGESEDYLNGLGNIRIHTGALASGTSFYCVGTGVSLTMRSGISSGLRGKEWGKPFGATTNWNGRACRNLIPVIRTRLRCFTKRFRRTVPAFRSGQATPVAELL